jgi:hypothetical protein
LWRSGLHTLNRPVEGGGEGGLLVWTDVHRRESRLAGRHSILYPAYRAGVGRKGRARLALVQMRCFADKGLEGLFVELLVLVDVDGAPGVAVEAGVEEAGGILQ